MNNNKYLCMVPVILFCLTVVISQYLINDVASAEETTTSTTAVTVSTSCQMNSTIDIPHTAEVPGSTYRDNIGKTTIKTLCNDHSGYAIYAIGYTNLEYGRNDMLGTLTGRTIASGTATEGDVSNWAMKIKAVDGEYKPTVLSDVNGSFANYHIIPNAFTKAVSFASNTDDILGSSIETTYAIYVSGPQVADTYTGKVKYTMIHPSDSQETPCIGNYSIVYNANGGSGNMDSQTACVDRQIGLLPNGFTPPTPLNEYQFAIWNTEPDGSGSNYYSGQLVANLASAGETVTLYAQWAPRYIQDMTTAMCNIVAKEQSFTVYDRRDGNDYKIRYLNNACWMTQNLRITGTVNSEGSNFNTHENVNVCTNDLTSGNSYDQPRCHDSGDVSTGVWYNYAAASAQTILGGSNSAEAIEDICPANWKIPSHDDSKSAGSADSLSDASTAVISAFSPVAGGFYSGGSIGKTNIGYWWTSIAYNSGTRYVLKYENGNLGVSYRYVSGVNYAYYDRYKGKYIRCSRAD